MVPIGTYTMAHATLVDHTDIQSAAEAILGFNHLISTLHWCHCFIDDFGGLKNKCPPKKVDQLAFNIDTMGTDRY